MQHLMEQWAECHAAQMGEHGGGGAAGSGVRGGGGGGGPLDAGGASSLDSSAAAAARQGGDGPYVVPIRSLAVDGLAVSLSVLTAAAPPV